MNKIDIHTIDINSYEISAENEKKVYYNVISGIKNTAPRMKITDGLESPQFILIDINSSNGFYSEAHNEILKHVTYTNSYVTSILIRLNYDEDTEKYVLADELHRYNIVLLDDEKDYVFEAGKQLNPESTPNFRPVHNNIKILDDKGKINLDKVFAIFLENQQTFKIIHRSITRDLPVVTIPVKITEQVSLDLNTELDNDLKHLANKLEYRFYSTINRIFRYPSLDNDADINDLINCITIPNFFYVLHRYILPFIVDKKYIKRWDNIINEMFEPSNGSNIMKINKMFFEKILDIINVNVKLEGGDDENWNIINKLLNNNNLLKYKYSDEVEKKISNTIQNMEQSDQNKYNSHRNKTLTYIRLFISIYKETEIAEDPVPRNTRNTPNNDYDMEDFQPADFLNMKKIKESTSGGRKSPQSTSGGRKSPPPPLKFPSKSILKITTERIPSPSPRTVDRKSPFPSTLYARGPRDDYELLDITTLFNEYRYVPPKLLVIDSQRKIIIEHIEENFDNHRIIYKPDGWQSQHVSKGEKIRKEEKIKLEEKKIKLEEEINKDKKKIKEINDKIKFNDLFNDLNRHAMNIFQQPARASELYKTNITF